MTSCTLVECPDPGQVVDVCVGRSVPEVDDFRALPTPRGAIWPQMLLDISYRGKPPPLSPLRLEFAPSLPPGLQELALQSWRSCKC